MNRHNWSAALVLMVMLLGLVYLHHLPGMHSFPKHIHAWTQSDRYALALGFVDNGMDLLHPETYNLKPDPASTRITPVTAVDFPIYEYCVAMVMKLSGNRTPFVFRWFTLLLSVISLVYLYKLGRMVAGHMIAGLFVAGFCATAPVYIYYQSGFLPALNSLSVFIVGLYYYFNYLRNRQSSQFIIAVCCLALAAAARTPFAIFLIAVTLHRLLQYMNDAHTNRRELWALAAGYVFVGGYFIYNLYLKSVFNTAFLGHPMPAHSMDEFYALVTEVRHRWMYHYLTHYHYFALIVLMLTTMLRNLNGKLAAEAPKNMFTLTAIAFLGALIYSVLMARQFADHDYYFLETFFPVILMLVIANLAMIPYKNQPARYATIMLAIVFFVFAVRSGHGTLDKRNESGPWDRIEQTRINFEGSAEWLDNTGVAADAHILVIDAYTTNGPLIFMNRKGFTVLNTTRENILQSMRWPFDYVIMQNEYMLSDVVRNYPQIVQQLEFVSSNEKLSLFKLNPSPSRILSAFLGLPSGSIYNNCLRFGAALSSWSGDIVAMTEGSMNAETEYSATLTIDRSSLTGTLSTLVFEGDFLSPDTLNGIELVVSASRQDDQVYYKTFELEKYIDNARQWTSLQFLFPLTEIPNDITQIKVYVWNHGRNNIRYKNWCVNIY